ncbi:MAG TPA: M48 family metallopeptidase [Stellaceae bacterium]|nr:M48 family metallopeptidase [Stellaceae bacterium]
MSVALGADGLHLVAGDGSKTIWPYQAISELPHERRSAEVRLGHGEARLSVEDGAFAAALARVAPAIRRRARRGLRYGAAATLAVLAVVGLVTWGMPRIAAWLVAFVPIEWEQSLSKDVEHEPWWGARCADPAGEAALAKLTRRLTDGVESPYPIQVSVRDNRLVNAFALPGGRIVLLRGLVADAQSPDEVAGVLAHELTHVLKRHPMRALIANSGLALLFELTIGNGTGASLGLVLATLSYTRAMEAEADAGALDLLRRAGISSAGFAAFFERLETREEGNGKLISFGFALPSYLRTHPATQQRLAAIRADGGLSTHPALEAADWQALKVICPDKK